MHYILERLIMFNLKAIPIYFFFNFFLMTSHFQLHSKLIDLEKDMCDAFVLETKKIEIPGYPDAFNPSMIQWHHDRLLSFQSVQKKKDDENIYYSHPYLMCFRAYDATHTSTNQIVLVLLDQNFEPISAPQEINITYNNSRFSLRQQDPRLINIDDHIYIVYSNIIEKEEVPEIRRMFIVELFFENGIFFTGEPSCLWSFEGENAQRWQKNWVPFEYQHQLLMAYSIAPHRILQPNLKTGICETIAKTWGTINWNWGTLRGGTPALPLNDQEYLAIFHSSTEMPTVQSNGKKISHYFMGAYTFAAGPPFSIKRISQKPIVGQNFYNGPAHKTWKPLRVVFPCGLHFDDKHVWISYGRQDHEVWIAKLDKIKLLESLLPVDILQNLSIQLKEP